MYENERWQREWLRVGREEREREEQGMRKGARTARFCMKRPCLLLQLISKVQMRYGQVPGKSRADPVQAGHIIRIIEWSAVRDITVLLRKYPPPISRPSKVVISVILQYFVCRYKR